VPQPRRWTFSARGWHQQSGSDSLRCGAEGHSQFNSKNDTRRVLTITRHSGRRAYVLELSRLMNLPTSALTDVPRALVLIRDPEARASIDQHLLAKHFSLTQAEARVAGLLFSGHSLTSAAKTSGIAPSTVRSQLKSVFRKVGVARQADLIRALGHLSSQSITRRTL
jgi:DNA-binding CsgD family transcriptional regulator